MLEAKIEQLLEQKFQEEEFADCFLVEIKLHDHKKLDVFVDSDSGMSFRKCQRLSRYLEGFIDEEGWLGEKYVLEVSSPGITRPLKFARQYVKNIGRNLKLKLQDDTDDEGMLIEANDTTFTLEKEVVIREGKKKRKEIVQTQYMYTAIKKAVIQISFKKKK